MRSTELSAFLRSRRARVTPQEVGLPAGARRRTAGLRREEVAVLAGVGASWYQWLEQGREITVSPQVLDAVARVLRLDAAERRHLYVLAGLNPPLPQLSCPMEEVCEGLQRVLDAWLPHPAHLVDPYGTTVAFNSAAATVLDVRHGTSRLLDFFLYGRARERETSWRRNAPLLVGELRAALAERPEDEGFRLLLEELHAHSPEFTELWERGDVAAPTQVRRELHHPALGALHFEVTTLSIPGRPDLRLLLHLPLPTDDAAASPARTAPR